ncbi:hypothetical protein Z517_07183 [Fonsecaea pedrosoi CBS 271.37]|uniref:Protein kinase domain-containing protein n=1 Tax=Fonsecaea pedrosoi CBS 271.37 TaxID=1442368 RepID=A0A0D2F1T4_9EURO|nr:uncharacterized protein Z517_07183 [Fonsecaea pedrosoi CBS 271.37]KIW80567.1 hypothetical protein Z517_07183 [Fonsecaea pedrosoi CBS 271.37]
MSSDELERLRQLLDEQTRLREEEQRLRLVAEERATLEQRRREEELAYFEHRTGKTSLPEFLDACHTYLHKDLTIQDRAESTQGTPANADQKLRPDRIVPWTNFAAQQIHVWGLLMESDFVSERHFSSRHTLQEGGNQLHQRSLSSELDLHYFVRFAVNDRVTSIVERLSQHPDLRESLGLRGSVKFENHGNMLSPDDVLTDLENLAVAQPRRRSPRLQYPSEFNATLPRSSSPSRSRPSVPRADQFCVYSVTDGDGNVTHKVPLLVMEYKAAHKLTLGHLYTGLAEMVLDDIIQEQLEEDVSRKCQRLVAAVLTQAFASMIAARLEFGCVFTGEAMVFLRIPEECSCLQYALVVPQGDVGLTTGWTPNLDADNRLHLTAVGQLLAFTLNAIRSPRRSLRWRQEAERRLQTWQLVLEELAAKVPEEEVPGSEYRPPCGNEAYLLGRSPIRRRLRPRHFATSDTGETGRKYSEESDADDGDDGYDGNGFPSGTPSRAPINKSRAPTHGGTRCGRPGSRGSSSTTQPGSGRQRDLGPYCSALCLKGLVEQGPLDRSCPNVRQHGTGLHHALDRRQFIQLVRRVFQKDLDYCEELFLYGATGCLYRLRLPGWGYTVVAKGTRPEFVRDLQREATIYQTFLKQLQGTWTPVYLGSLHLNQPLSYAGIAPISYLMVLSYGGYSINHMRTVPVVVDAALEGLRAIHRQGILHGDIAPRNILWNASTQQVVWHDFGSAKVNRPPPLGKKSVNPQTVTVLGKRSASSVVALFEAELSKVSAIFKPKRSVVRENPLLSAYASRWRNPTEVPKNREEASSMSLHVIAQ